MSGSDTAVTGSVTEWYFPPDRWPRSNLQMLRDSAAPNKNCRTFCLGLHNPDDKCYKQSHNQKLQNQLVQMGTSYEKDEI